MTFAIRLDLEASRRSDDSAILWGPAWFEVRGWDATELRRYQALLVGSRA